MLLAAGRQQGLAALLEPELRPAALPQEASLLAVVSSRLEQVGLRLVLQVALAPSMVRRMEHPLAQAGSLVLRREPVLRELPSARERQLVRPLVLEPMQVASYPVRIPLPSERQVLCRELLAFCVLWRLLLRRR